MFMVNRSPHGKEKSGEGTKMRFGVVRNWEGGQPGMPCTFSLTCGHDCLNSKSVEEEKLNKAMPEELAQLRSVTRKKNNFEAEDSVTG